MGKKHERHTNLVRYFDARTGQAMMNPLVRNAVDARRGARDELGGREGVDEMD